MAESQNWAEALKINPKKLKEWTALAPDGTPVLVYVLQEGHVPAQQYLEWASNHYNLPVVQENFFQEAFSVDVARNLQFDSPNGGWKPWMFPMEQWDGIILVGCVEPPAEPHGNQFRYVLADPGALQQKWSDMASSMAATSLDEDPPEVPPTDAPQGLNPSGAQPFKLSLDNIDETNIFKKFDLTGAEPAPAKAAKAAPPPPAAPKAAPPKIASPPLPDAPEAPEVPALAITVSPDEPTVARAPAPEPKPQAKPKTEEKPAAKPKTGGAALTATQQAQVIEVVFEQLKGLYRHVFIMKCKDGKASLFKWDNTLEPVDGGKKVSVDLAFPTFFRIIEKTHLPYHGYLVDSPAHREFFSGFNITELPGCVTGMPLKDGENLVGVLVGVGDDNLQKLEILRKAEEISARLNDGLAAAWGKSA